MLPWLSSGNASSLHAEGRKAKDALDTAREVLATAFDSLFAEVLFTSGGTEAANLAILGSAIANEDTRRRRVLLGAAEHHCVHHTEGLLRHLGYEVQYVPVDREGMTNLDALEAMVGEDVLLVSIMRANNELGTIQPTRAIVGMAHRHGIRVHVDAVQAFLKPELAERVSELGADLVTVSSHKVNGPKAVGAIYVRAGTPIKSLVGGGGQEREVRGGTENLAGIVGFGAAVKEQLATPKPTDPELRERLAARLVKREAIRTVAHAPTLNGHLHVRFPGIDADTMLIAFDRAGIAASSGAACSSGSVEPSHVMLACGYSPREAREGIRFTLGPETSIAQIEEAADRIDAILYRIGIQRFRADAR